MRNYYFLLILVAFTSCVQDEPTLKVKACFEYSTDSVLVVGDSIKFSNCSENATNYMWDFGDSTTSTEFSPVHLYKKGGSYVVKLKAINNSDIDTLSKSIEITDPYYTNLKDTLIIPMSLSWGDNKKIYDLDIDKDSRMDITITITSSYIHFGASRDIKIACHNGFELAFSTYIDPTKKWTNILPGTLNPNDTIIILPKEFNYGDIIQMNGDYRASLIIRHLESSGDVNGNKVFVNYGVSLKKELYFAFRNENANILGWLKLNVTSTASMRLNSYRYINSGNTLKIE